MTCTLLTFCFFPISFAPEVIARGLSRNFFVIKSCLSTRSPQTRCDTCIWHCTRNGKAIFTPSCMSRCACSTNCLTPKIIDNISAQFSVCCSPQDSRSCSNLARKRDYIQTKSWPSHFTGGACHYKRNRLIDLPVFTSPRTSETCNFSLERMEISTKKRNQLCNSSPRKLTPEPTQIGHDTWPCLLQQLTILGTA